MKMSAINAQATALNETISAVNPAVLDMLSVRGKAIFFPAKGILGQSAAAKGKEINATIGTALEDDGSPLALDCITELINVDTAKAVLYAPSYGLPDLRDTWKTMMLKKNPNLAGKTIGRPVVSQALTHALSIASYLFLGEGEELILPDLYWGNYNLIFKEHYGVAIKTYNTFVDEGFDIAALSEAIKAGGPGKKVVLLNFPNNPTGYTVTKQEAVALKQALLEAAEAGNKLVVLLDDAYFGLVYEDNVYEESMFGELADLHENILAVKLDGPTKEDYVWGFRVGFITFGAKGGTPELYAALEAKTAGAIRGNISNASAVSQTILLKAFTHPDYDKQKLEKYNTLKARCTKLTEILASHPEYAEAFEALPFNSGYFMCVRLKNADPEAVRQVLLKDYSTGLIAASGLIRIAFSSTPLGQLEKLFSNLYQAVKSLQ
ncbi:aminotransferase class I/II-fold pyridoxal phosphate-dependent enzyme [Planctomycetota bacterium]